MQHANEKEEAPHDALFLYFLNLWGAVERNYAKILAGIGAVVVIALIALFVYRQEVQNTEAAVQAMGEVYIALFQGDVDQATAKAQGVLNDYSGKPVAREALIALANLSFEQENIPGARTYFQQYIDQHGSEGSLGYGAWAGLAACLEMEEKFAEAAQKFLGYADAHSKTPFAPVALKEAGRCFELAASVEQAKTAYQRIVDQYGDSPVANAARGELAMLGIEVD